MRGVSLEELSSATRISTRFLTAIENGQWEELPGGAFNRGYIRSASRYLGLDEDGMVAEYALETNKGIQPVIVQAIPRRHGQAAAKWRLRSATNKRRAWARLAAICAIGVLVIVAGWLAGTNIARRVRARRAIAGLVASKAANPKPNAAAATTPTVAPTVLALTVQAARRARVTVKADGKTVFDGEMKAGEQETFNAQKAFDVSTNHARAVRLELNGQPAASMGAGNRSASVTLTAKDLKSPQ